MHTVGWSNPINSHPLREVYYHHYFRIGRMYGGRPEGIRAYRRLRAAFGLSVNL